MEHALLHPILERLRWWGNRPLLLLGCTFSCLALVLAAIDQIPTMIQVWYVALLFFAGHTVVFAYLHLRSRNEGVPSRDASFDEPRRLHLSAPLWLRPSTGSSDGLRTRTHTFRASSFITSSNSTTSLRLSPYCCLLNGAQASISTSATARTAFPGHSGGNPRDTFEQLSRRTPLCFSLHLRRPLAGCYGSWLARLTQPLKLTRPASAFSQCATMSRAGRAA